MANNNIISKTRFLLQSKDKTQITYATFNVNMKPVKDAIGSGVSLCIIVHHENAMACHLDDFHYASHQPKTTKFPVEPQRPMPHLLTFPGTMDQLVVYLVYIYVFHDHGTSLMHFLSKVLSRDNIFQLPQAGGASESAVSRSPGRHRRNWWLLRPVWIMWIVFGPTVMALLIRSPPLAFCSTRSQSA